MLGIFIYLSVKKQIEADIDILSVKIVVAQIPII